MKKKDLKKGVELYVFYDGKWRLMEVERHSFDDWWLRYKPTPKSKYYRSTGLRDHPFCSKDELPVARAALKKKMRDAEAKAKAELAARAEKHLKYRALHDELLALGVRVSMFNRMSRADGFLTSIECCLDEVEAQLLIDALKKEKGVTA